MPLFPILLQVHWYAKNHPCRIRQMGSRRCSMQMAELHSTRSLQNRSEILRDPRRRRFLRSEDGASDDFDVERRQEFRCCGKTIRCEIERKVRWRRPALLDWMLTRWRHIPTAARGRKPTLRHEPVKVHASLSLFARCGRKSIEISENIGW